MLIDVGAFTTALKYVLQKKLDRSFHLYEVKYGHVEFSVHNIRFKFLFPLGDRVRLLCKHLEGDKYINTHYNIHKEDPLQRLFTIIEQAIAKVKPIYYKVEEHEEDNPAGS